MIDKLISFFGLLFWKTPVIGPNTVLIIEGRPNEDGKETPSGSDLCGLHRYRLKDHLVFRPGISGVNHRVYRATDPITGAVIQIPHNVFHSLFNPTKVNLHHE